MDETEAKTFSFSKAYDHFKTAASLGHTLAAYNIGVMHFVNNILLHLLAIFV